MVKQEYKIKDRVWIHLGEPNLVEGRIVSIVNLDHLGEPNSMEKDLYVIEIPTALDPVYEVRDWTGISPDENGPINLFRMLKNEVSAANRFLKSVGTRLPNFDHVAEVVKPKKRFHRKKKQKVE